MAEIIVEPTALSKVIPLKFKINDVDVPKTTQLSTNKQFNTTDTDAWFTFELDGLAATNGTYDLTLINLDDKSIFHHDHVLFPTLPFHYKLNSSEDVTLNEIRHAGRWLGQLVVTMGNGDTTSRQFGFNIAGHILDGQDAQVILLSDYQALINTINLAKDDLAQYNIDYAALIADVMTAEGVREQAEIDRAAVFATLVESEMVAQNVATKLAEKEATFAPRMLSLESELAETNLIADEAIAKADAMASGSPKGVYATLALLQAAYPTGTTGAYLVTADGKWYYWNGTTWRAGGTYQSAGIAKGSVDSDVIKTASLRADNTRFLKVNKNKFDKTDTMVGYYVDNVTGQLKASAGWTASGYMKITESTAWHFLWYNGGLWGDSTSLYYTYYDVNYNFIAGYIGKVIDNVVPTGAVFIIVSGYDNRFQDSYYPMMVTDVVFNEVYTPVVGGSTPSVYYPFSVSFDQLTLDTVQINNLIEYDNNANEKYFMKQNIGRTIRSIARMGYYINNVKTPPQESIDGFKLARAKGFDTLRCNLRFTLDSVPVCLHDATINNNNARFKDGGTITTPVNVSSLTYQQIIDTYDFGLYKGWTGGYPLLKLVDMITLSKKIGAEVYIEMKDVPTEAQARDVVFIVKKLGMVNAVTWIGYNSHINTLQYIRDLSPKSKRFGVIYDYLDDTAISRMLMVKTSSIEVFLWGWNTMTLTDTLLNKLIDADIALEIGTIDTEQGILDYTQGLYLYVTGIESNIYVAGKVLYDSLI